MFSSRIIQAIALISISLVGICSPAIAASTSYSSVVLIRSYVYDSVTDAYSVYAEGSAVIVGTRSIITNAHVVLGAGDIPTGYYEICVTRVFNSPPQCSMTASLKSYDTEVDLALLEPSTAFAPSQVIPVTDATVDLGTAVTVYGYPAIGGATITSTTGKVAGYEAGVYKLDATIDHGNSGGGVFDTRGVLVGIPYAIRSDNSTIGYMIPMSRVISYMAGRTPDTQKFSSNTTAYIAYMTSQRKLNTASKINNASIIVASPRSYGYQIYKGVASKDTLLSQTNLQSNNKRVYIGYACMQVQGDQTLASVQEASMLDMTDDSGEYTYATSYIGPNQAWTQIVMIPSDATKKLGIWYIYPRGYSNCGVTITAVNRITDIKNIEKAIQLVTVGTVWKSTPRSVTITDPAFSKGTIQIPNTIRIHKIIATTGDVSYGLWYMQSSKHYISGDVSIRSMSSLKKLFTAFDSSYTSSDLSFSAFERVYAKNNKDTVKDTSYTTRSGQKYIVTVSTNGNRKTISAIYPFRTATGELKVWSLTGLTMYAPTDADMTGIVSFLSSLDFPGTSALN